jgi:HTH-type transcriptional regulator/antitoxin HigA
MMTRTANEIIPDTATHPGEALLEEIEFRGISQRELARQTERPYSVINQIVRGRRRMDAATALDLERVLGIKAHLWLNMQSRYDLVTEYNARKQRKARSA